MIDTLLQTFENFINEADKMMKENVGLVALNGQNNRCLGIFHALFALSNDLFTTEQMLKYNSLMSRLNDQTYYINEQLKNVAIILMNKE